MTIASAEWLHGTAFDVEHEGDFETIEHKGWGLMLTGKPDRQAWVHAAIATPVIIDGKRPQLGKLFVLFRSSDPTPLPPAKIVALHVYDGAKKIASLDGLDRHGMHDQGLDAANSFSIGGTPTIMFGLGLSLCIAFATGPASRSITLATAGADFVMG